MLRFLIRNGVRKGLLGGSRPWLVLGGAAMVLRVVRKLGGSEPEVVFCDELKPGEAVVVAHDRDAMMKG